MNVAETLLWTEISFIKSLFTKIPECADWALVCFPVSAVMLSPSLPRSVFPRVSSVFQLSFSVSFRFVLS